MPDGPNGKPGNGTTIPLDLTEEVPETQDQRQPIRAGEEVHPSDLLKFARQIALGCAVVAGGFALGGLLLPVLVIDWWNIPVDGDLHKFLLDS